MKKIPLILTRGIAGWLQLEGPRQTTIIQTEGEWDAEEVREETYTLKGKRFKLITLSK